ncbi:MAG: hypothetical protein RQ743_14310, partial [Bacteroidales bacterium]|nr:hypothetical protein [Bacteroidales bacterium]
VAIKLPGSGEEEQTDLDGGEGSRRGVGSGGRCLVRLLFKTDKCGLILRINLLRRYHIQNKKGIEFNT